MTSLSKSVRIRSPVDDVYAVAEDRKRWERWYEGWSREETISSGRTAGGRPWLVSVSVGVPFPLTQRVLEDSIHAQGGCWRTRPEGPTEVCSIGPGRAVVLLNAKQTWSYRPIDSTTEVKVDIEFEPPTALFGRHKVQERLIERLEIHCLKRSLENLRQLCEAA